MLVKNNFFFSKEECEEIVVLCEKAGITPIHKIDAYNKWDMLRIHDNSIKEKILERYKEVFSNDTTLSFDLNAITTNHISLSLTRYYDGRFLEMHRDTSSELTSVVVLTDNFEDGRFVLSDDKVSIEHKTINDTHLYSISQGNSLTFNGHTIWHGVMPVYEGIRKSLNIWVEPESFKIQSGDNEFEVKIQKSFL
jgi:Rps23 Pro-64 3,4-dihydroxylase Tpa1-like proline 4-hydroxylase